MEAQIFYLLDAAALALCCLQLKPYFFMRIINLCFPLNS